MIDGDEGDEITLENMLFDEFGYVSNNGENC